MLDFLRTAGHSADRTAAAAGDSLIAAINGADRAHAAIGDTLKAVVYGTDCALAAAEDILRTKPVVYSADRTTAAAEDILQADLHRADCTLTAAEDILKAAVHDAYRTHAAAGDILLGAVHSADRTAAADGDILRAAVHGTDRAALPGSYILAIAGNHGSYAGIAVILSCFGPGEYGPVHHVCQLRQHGVVQRLGLAACRLRRSNQLLFCPGQRCQRSYCVHKVHAHDYCRQDLFRFLFVHTSAFSVVFHWPVFFPYTRHQCLVTTDIFSAASSSSLRAVNCCSKSAATSADASGCSSM